MGDSLDPLPLSRLAAFLRPDWSRTVGARRALAGALVVLAAIAAWRDDPRADHTDVVVTTRDLAPGTELTNDDIRLETRTASSIPDGSRADVEAVIGTTLAGPARRGEVITDVRLLGPRLAESAAGPHARVVALPLADAARGRREGGRRCRAGSGHHADAALDPNTISPPVLSTGGEIASVRSESVRVTRAALRAGGGVLGIEVATPRVRGGQADGGPAAGSHPFRATLFGLLGRGADVAADHRRRAQRAGVDRAVVSARDRSGLARVHHSVAAHLNQGGIVGVRRRGSCTERERSHAEREGTETGNSQLLGILGDSGHQAYPFLRRIACETELKHSSSGARLSARTHPRMPSPSKANCLGKT